MKHEIFFYDFEVFKHDWIVVFKHLGSDLDLIFHNEPEELKKFLTTVHVLIGFNNYNYDDLILYSLVKENYTPTQLYELSQKIINGDNIIQKYKINNLVTLDCMQELQQGVGLKSIEANIGIDIQESSVPWNIDRPLKLDEVRNIYKYCLHDVKNTEYVFKKRQDYFETKIDIIKEFKLEPLLIKKTRSSLAAEVLKANKKNLPKEAIKDRLNIKYVAAIPWRSELLTIKKFYDSIINRFNNGEDYILLEKENLNIDINGIEHKFGFGGVHGGKKSYEYEGDILYFDVSSYYPSIMINFNFLSRACENKKDFKDLYDTRFKLKKEKNTMEYIYKILLNASYGATKDKYSKMFDPLQANNICINGQILLTDLLLRLKPYIELIQTNTDGIIFKYNPIDYLNIIKIKTEWEMCYGLKLGEDKLKAIYQRDVNNYLIVKSDGSIKGKGRIKNWDTNKINYDSYTLAVIDIAFKKYYIDDMSVEDTINELLANNKLAPFQIICKKSNKYESLAQYSNITNSYIELPNKVNRVFATTLLNNGMVYKVKNGRYDKYTNTPEKTYIHNDNLNNMDSKLIDKDWYIRLCTKYLLENQVIKQRLKLKNLNQLSLFDL
ncbi:hypothetical protein [Streptobacillus moniliformis]|uniref:hypothetical protein n=1 Tax=Streptobacillus moniliformis TaxID=34105 RepID=UPI0007E31150|nr:hypothetical protein [Streptobacillus moniliformis]